MPYKKLVLAELQQPTVEETQPSTLQFEENSSEPEPKVEPAEIVTVTPPPDIRSPVVVAAKTGDPPTGWRQLLLSGDPISVTEVTNVWQDPTNVFSGLVTAQYNSQIVAPTSAQSLQVFLLDLWNVGTNTAVVALSWGPATSAAAFRFRKNLAPNTGFALNLINTVWRGPTNTGLYIYAFNPISTSDTYPNLTYTILGQYSP